MFFQTYEHFFVLAAIISNFLASKRNCLLRCLTLWLYFIEITTIDSRLAKRTQILAGEKLADRDAEETATISRE